MGCCPPNSWPALTIQYNPKGNVLTHDGIQIYRVGQGKKALVLITDIFGFNHGRHKSIADTYAQLGYNVYLPQVLPKTFSGDVTKMQQIGAYLKSLDQNQIKKRFDNTISLLQKDGNKRFFAAGFCWGVWKGFVFASEYENMICLAGFHPSIIVQNMIGRNQLQLAKKAKCPAQFYAAGNDDNAVKPGGDIVKILADKFGADKVGSFQYPEMLHGWVIRGDLNIEAVKRDASQAIAHSHQYFQKFTI